MENPRGKLMKKFPVLLISLLFISFLTAASAEEKKDTNGPRLSVGIIGMFGTSSILIDHDDDAEVDPGYIAGGGIQLEKSLSNYFALGSGAQYRYFKNDIEMVDESTLEEFKAKWTFHAISLPFHLITSIKGPKSSLNVYTGLTYTHIFSSKMSTDDTLTSGIKNDDAMKFINSTQVGVSGGLIFKFMVTEYTDFFMGIMAEYYPTDLIKNSGDGDAIHLLNYSFNTGYMFRTNMFNL